MVNFLFLQYSLAQILKVFVKEKMFLAQTILNHVHIFSLSTAKLHRGSRTVRKSCPNFHHNSFRVLVYSSSPFRPIMGTTVCSNFHHNSFHFFQSIRQARKAHYRNDCLTPIHLSVRPVMPYIQTVLVPLSCYLFFFFFFFQVLGLERRHLF